MSVEYTRQRFIAEHAPLVGMLEVEFACAMDSDKESRWDDLVDDWCRTMEKHAKTERNIALTILPEFVTETMKKLVPQYTVQQKPFIEGSRWFVVEGGAA